MKVLFLLFLSIPIYLNSQSSVLKTKIEVLFKNNLNSKFGFDEFKSLKSVNSTSIVKKRNHTFYYKSVNLNESDKVNAVIRSEDKFLVSKIEFYIENKMISKTKINDSTFTLNLPKKRNSYSLYAKHRNKIIARLYVKVYSEMCEKAVLIPVFSSNEINLKKVTIDVNNIFKQANIRFDFELDKSFNPKVFKHTESISLLDSLKISYSGQMRLLRDLYLELHPNLDKKRNYIFIINHFSDSNTFYFSLKGKAISFVKNNENLARSIAQSLCVSIGKMESHTYLNDLKEDTLNNLMNSLNGYNLTFPQWENLRNHDANYSFFDQTENVKTNNGLVAYYFWNENNDGTIDFQNNFLKSIKRPFKKNFLSYRFDVKYKILKPFFKLSSYHISILNVLFFILFTVLAVFLRMKLIAFWSRKKLKYRFFKRLSLLIIYSFCVTLFSLSFILSNSILNNYKVVSGPIPELNNLNFTNVSKALLTKKELTHQESTDVSSEILINKNGHWEIKKRMKVLYFQSVVINGKPKIKFISNSDSLILRSKNYFEKVSNHYIVVEHLKKDSSFLKQEVFDYYGNEVGKKIQNKNSSKRVLLFVNGYRPTSVGHTFEENFKDIKNNGLEFPDSKNLIYDFDRYAYWEQWNQINLLFQNKINPSEVYYADGHFSVSTSNYRSLLSFTNTSTIYPKRCPNNKKHTCKWVKRPLYKKYFVQNKKTINLLKNRSNKKGFSIRRKKGRIAGLNLLQTLNKIPKQSENDTIFIVAHSMGFAYSLGMIDVIKNKINFGGFYIIAPENAKSGSVQQELWPEIWQYGSDFNSSTEDAPCLQDGVAPQYKVRGLSVKKRVYIPKNLYQRKGFFDSHFIGYYTWIFELKSSEKGYIPQH